MAIDGVHVCQVRYDTRNCAGPAIKSGHKSKTTTVGCQDAGYHRPGGMIMIRFHPSMALQILATVECRGKNLNFDDYLYA